MDKEFREFHTSKLFDIHPTKAYKMSNGDLYKTAGNTPVLSNSSTNNGIGGYCGLEPTEEGNIITFSDTTTGTDTMFYQPNSFVGYPHIQGLYPYDTEHWNEKECLYFIGVMKTACGKGWSYSNKFTRVFVLDTTPLLPIKQDENGNPIIDDTHFYHEEGFVPDFDYMRERIEELERERIEELERYLLATGLNDYELTDEDIKTLSLSGFGHYEERDSEDVVKVCKEFKVSDLFESFNGDTDLQKSHINEQGYDVVSSGIENNGIIGKTDIKAKIFNADTITIDMFGNCFYRDEQYKMVTHARVFSLYPLFEGLNNVNGQYIVSQFKYLPTVYNYSNMCSWNKIKNDTLNLPIQTDTDNNPIIDIDHKYHPDGYIPDWNFMEKYIRAIEKIVIADVVKYKDDVISRTKESVK